MQIINRDALRVTAGKPLIDWVNSIDPLHPFPAGPAKPFLHGIWRFSAFLRIMENYPAIDLWAPDGSHPSLSGSWLIASTLFSTVFKRSPVESPANPGLPESVDSLPERRILSGKLIKD